jgi:hypothetical protein
MSKLILATVAALCLTCACAKTKVYSTKEGSLEVTDQGKEQVIHVTGKDGKSVDINTGKAITDYPSDTPLYSGKAEMDLKSNENHSRVVAIQTPDSIDKINTFYKAELEAKGWKIETNMTTPEMTLYAATKGDRKLVIQVSGDPSEKMQTINQTLADK